MYTGVPGESDPPRDGMPVVVGASVVVSSLGTIFATPKSSTFIVPSGIT